MPKLFEWNSPTATWPASLFRTSNPPRLVTASLNSSSRGVVHVSPAGGSCTSGDIFLRLPLAS